MPFRSLFFALLAIGVSGAANAQVPGAALAPGEAMRSPDLLQVAAKPTKKRRAARARARTYSRAPQPAYATPAYQPGPAAAPTVRSTGNPAVDSYDPATASSGGGY